MSSKFTAAAVIAAVAGLAFIGGRASTEFSNAAVAAQPEGADMMPPWMSLSEEHKRLESMLGDWTGTVRFKMAGQWMESDAKIHREMIMDGRFVIEHVTGSSDMGEFKGMGLVGYNPMSKRYESIWVENMATNITVGGGTYDDATKTWTFDGPMMDPMTGQMVDTVTYVDTSDPDKHVMKGYVVTANATKEQNFEGTFSRVK